MVVYPFPIYSTTTELFKTSVKKLDDVEQTAYGKSQIPQRVQKLPAI